ncbi:hypothetical protein BD779DRAFT_1472676 [Infundibulicybe gibba]|nr:hypothetical protein BD779DRAFT_1472676 [Infundibulicybe gibba]
MLESGEYIINNVGVERYVAPSDASQPPTPIIVLPPGTMAYRFVVERLHGNYYLIKAKGVLTGTIGDLVFAIDDNPVEKEWVITLRENHGPNIYTIEKPNPVGGGWVIPREEKEIVACRPLSATKSLPPQYFPEGLWIFSRAPQE